jgi:hypothetical protein
MTNNETYQAYAPNPIGQVPREEAQYLINLFMEEAAVNMGASVDEQTLDRVIQQILSNFSFLHVSYVASAFIRGSLGQFGAGRLVPRTIHGWLQEVQAEFNRMQQKEQLRASNSTPEISIDLFKFPAGRAIAQKIDWFRAGLLPGDDWDKVDLQQLANAMGRHEVIEFNNFYKTP